MAALAMSLAAPARIAATPVSAGKSFLSGSALPAAPVVRIAGPARGALQTQAFFNFGNKGGGGGGGGAVADPTPYICVDCGYIYKGGDFRKLPRSYKCPTCDVGKNRFKPYQSNGSYYSSMAAEKKANKKALREGTSEKGAARRAQKAKLAEMYAQKDGGKKTRGGKADEKPKKKGFFGR